MTDSDTAMSAVAVPEGALPEGWARATLGELCEVNPRAFDEEPGDDDLISQVPMAAVEAETGRMDASMHVRYGDIKKKSLTRFQENDVLFAKITPCMENGKIAKARGIGRRPRAGQHGIPCAAESRRGPSRVPGVLLAPAQCPSGCRAAHVGRCGGQRRVPRPYLEGLEVPVPPLAEQHRIVAKLDEQLTHIEAGEAAAREALSLAEALFEQVTALGVTGGLGSAERVSLSIEPADCDDGDLPALPTGGWRWARLGGHCRSCRRCHQGQQAAARSAVYRGALPARGKCSTWAPCAGPSREHPSTGSEGGEPQAQGR